MQDITDDIVRRAIEGDLGAFELIYKATSSFVYNVSLRVLNDPRDAEEVTQDVFLTVHHKLKEFRSQSSFKTWVYRIAVNAAINHGKKSSKERSRTVGYDEEITPVAVTGEVRMRMDQEHQEQQVQMLLNALTPEQKTCVLLRNMQGLSYQQIAETLNINVNTVRSRLKRGRETLLTLKNEVTNHEL